MKVFLLEKGEGMFPRLLSSFLTRYGHSLRVFTSPSDLHAAITEDAACDLVVIDVEHVGGRLPSSLWRKLHSRPVIFLRSDSRPGRTGVPSLGMELEKPVSFIKLLRAMESLGDAESMPRTKSAPRVHEQRSNKIMVVDDEEGYRIYVSELLKSLGYTPVTATDGIETLELLRRHPDITDFVLDLLMPRMDGRELIKELRRRIANPSILVMTASLDEELKQWVLEEGGAYALIQKPFTSKTFKRYFNM